MASSGSGGGRRAQRQPIGRGPGEERRPVAPRRSGRRWNVLRLCPPGSGRCGWAQFEAPGRVRRDDPIGRFTMLPREGREEGRPPVRHDAGVLAGTTGDEARAAIRMARRRRALKLPSIHCASLRSSCEPILVLDDEATGRWLADAFGVRRVVGTSDDASDLTTVAPGALSTGRHRRRTTGASWASTLRPSGGHGYSVVLQLSYSVVLQLSGRSGARTVRRSGGLLHRQVLRSRLRRMT